MTKHLSPEKIKRLIESKITGADFADALLHIEGCGECRKLIPPATRAEIIGRLLSDDAPPEGETKPQPQRKFIGKKPGEC